MDIKVFDYLNLEVCISVVCLTNSILCTTRLLIFESHACTQTHTHTHTHTHTCYLCVKFVLRIQLLWEIPVSQCVSWRGLWPKLGLDTINDFLIASANGKWLLFMAFVGVFSMFVLYFECLVNNFFFCQGVSHKERGLYILELIV